MPRTCQQLEIAGKPAEVYELSRSPRFGLLYLHDFAHTKFRDHPRFAELLERHSFACICPEGKRCWWVDRVCHEFDADISPEAYLLAAVMRMTIASPLRIFSTTSIGESGSVNW